RKQLRASTRTAPRTRPHRPLSILVPIQHPRASLEHCMHVRYIGHASVSIDVAGRRILCDPWWSGPAFGGRWLQYPPPQPRPNEAQHADFLSLSDGHDDHLHVATLRPVRRGATVLLPRFADTALRDFLRSLGFHDIRELADGVRTPIAPGLCATAYV